ncbi:MAG: iron-containing alcohol dehydrogenase [Syntrophomonadaceae bacterium]|nr:iron-containing alcohol dehydrogenase [Syntrophomonadaceae bacterium]
MLWQANNPTHIVFGERALKSQGSLLKGLGKRVLVVTGQGGSAQRNGAQDDVIKAFKSAGISKHAVFAEVEPNPSVHTLRRGAQAAQEIKADIIVAIGGGSPMDAAKGIAVLALEDLSEEALFELRYRKALPIVAVPTTAGTGSEVTGSAIISSPLYQNKKNIGGPLLYPRIAFLDPRYTYDNPRQLTLDTALDAYAHALESYLAFRSNPISDTYSLRSLGIMGECLHMLSEAREYTPKERERLLLGSLLSGLAISITGVSMPHGMSYPLTYNRDIPHGRALSYIIPAWMSWIMRVSRNQRMQNALRASGFNTLAEMEGLLRALGGVAPKLSEQEREQYLQLTLDSKNVFNGVVFPQREDVKALLDDIFQ